jgi:hypothetical protein
MIKNGKLLSTRPVVQSDVQAMKEKRKLKVRTFINFNNTYMTFEHGLIITPFSG